MLNNRLVFFCRREAEAAHAGVERIAPDGLFPCDVMNMLLKSCFMKYHCIYYAEPAHRQLPCMLTSSVYRSNGAAIRWTCDHVLG